MSESDISKHPRVIFKDIDVRPWSECSGDGCQHPECIEKRKKEVEIEKLKIIAILHQEAKERKKARRKLVKIKIKELKNGRQGTH